jgi:outer membrane receptor protein involved in Fe transport
MLKVVKSYWVPIIGAFALVSLSSTPVWAEEDIEEVVVTGSYIKRSVQEQPNPVDVYDRSEWEEQGSPMAVEIIQNTPAMSGTLNQSEQYAGSGVAGGLKNINIRGLGTERSLVLLNGKRMAVAGASVGKGGQYVVDIGAFPNIAMKRIELLKNGGSVNYGTDAMAGVWNYITRDEFEGLEIQLNHADIDHSDGDQTVGIIYGVASDTVNLVTSFEYEKRNMLNIFEHNQVDHSGAWPLGVSSFGNPGTFTPRNYDASNQVVDPACGMSFGSNGGTAIENRFNTWSGCGYSYMPFANIIDPQDRKKFMAQVKVQVSDTAEVYGEVLWGHMTAVYNGSPSYPPTNPGANYFTVVPTHNPGLADLMANGMTAGQVAAFEATGGALWWGRSLAGEGPTVSFPRDHKALRIVGGSRGTLPFDFTNGIDYDISVAYSETTADLGGTDILTNRFDLAVHGLGGADCGRANDTPSDAANDAVRGDATAGCYYFNPAGSSIGASPSSPLYNDPDVRSWFTGQSSGITENKYAVTDIVFSGELPIEAGGGNIAFAAGGQYRWYESEYNPTGDNRVDGAQPSPFHFLGVSLYNYLETKNWAIFAEAAIPLSNSIDVEVGVRHEDYGLDSVTKPKLAGRWDVNEWLSLRASYEEVFRVPVLPNNPTISLELYAPLGEYLSIETPVPTNLAPEESDNFNIGAIIQPVDGMTITLDYYNMSLGGPFGREAATCACADLVTNDAGQVNKIITELINGDDIDTDGIDIEVDYRFNTSAGMMNVGVNGNYILSYDVAGELAADGTQTGGKYDAVGKYNVRATALPIEVRSMPQFKMNAWVGWSSENQSARLYARYIDGMDVDESSTAYGVAGLTTVDSMLSFDLHYSYEFMDNALRLTASVLNISDERAPLAPHEQGYDAYTHNPLGRVFKVGLRYSLGEG